MVPAPATETMSPAMPTAHHRKRMSSGASTPTDNVSLRSVSPPVSTSSVKTPSRGHASQQQQQLPEYLQEYLHGKDLATAARFTSAASRGRPTPLALINPVPLKPLGSSGSRSVSASDICINCNNSNNCNNCKEREQATGECDMLMKHIKYAVKATVADYMRFVTTDGSFVDDEDSAACMRRHVQKNALGKLVYHARANLSFLGISTLYWVLQLGNNLTNTTALNKAKTNDYKVKRTAAKAYVCNRTEDRMRSNAKTYNILYNSSATRRVIQ